MPDPDRPAPMWLLSLAQHLTDSTARRLLEPPNGVRVDFSQPRGEEALIPANSISWRIFKNPVALFVGGVAAVILELAEPKVRTGVWDHTSFRTDPVTRLRRTGLAAMITIYGARSTAEKMISGVVRLHGKVTGTTPAGASYNANDVDLLTWVQATAGFGFAEAYSRFVRPLSRDDFDHVYKESAPAANLYGALDAPTSAAEMNALFDSMKLRLEPSPIIFEFLQIMRDAPILPMPMRPVQGMLIRAAVDMTPDWLRERLGLDATHGLRSWERPLVRMAGRMSDRMLFRWSPAVQSCVRLGLPETYLYSEL